MSPDFSNPLVLDGFLNILALSPNPKDTFDEYGLNDLVVPEGYESINTEDRSFHYFFDMVMRLAPKFTDPVELHGRVELIYSRIYLSSSPSLLSRVESCLRQLYRQQSLYASPARLPQASPPRFELRPLGKNSRLLKLVFQHGPNMTDEHVRHLVNSLPREEKMRIGMIQDLHRSSLITDQSVSLVLESFPNLSWVSIAEEGGAIFPIELVSFLNKLMDSLNIKSELSTQPSILKTLFPLFERMWIAEPQLYGTLQSITDFLAKEWRGSLEKSTFNVFGTLFVENIPTRNFRAWLRKHLTKDVHCIYVVNNKQVLPTGLLKGFKNRTRPFAKSLLCQTYFISTENGTEYMTNGLIAESIKRDPRFSEKWREEGTNRVEFNGIDYSELRDFLVPVG